jgi:GrpB-like predicted nucleotidyltransferase (UPF0157 family)
MTSGEQPVEIVEYNSSWPLLFEQQREVLLSTFRTRLQSPDACEGNRERQSHEATEAKAPFINRIITLAREQGSVERE